MEKGNLSYRCTAHGITGKICNRYVYNTTIKYEYDITKDGRFVTQHRIMGWYCLKHLKLRYAKR